MKNLLGPIALCLVLASCNSSTSSAIIVDDKPTAEIEWHKNYEEAKNTARLSKKLVMIKFYADWCGPCKELEATTLTDPSVVERINQRFIPVKLNVDQQDYGNLAHNQYGVVGIPDVTIVRSDGKVVTHIHGVFTKEEFLAKTEKL